MNLFLIFLTGLTTGSFTCLAIQGGLLASLISNSTQPDSKNNTSNPKFAGHQALYSFLLGKLLSHALIGALLGALGASISLPPVIRGYLQILIGIFLLGSAVNLLEIHPIFRYFAFTPPRFLARLVKNSTQNHLPNIIAPSLVGAFTVLIPCATTQAMLLLAIGSGSAFLGSAILLAFVLGTIPSFLIFGYTLNTLTSFRTIFPKIAFAILTFMAFYTINSGISLTGSVYTFQNFYEAAISSPEQTPDTDSPAIKNGIQYATLTVTNRGYEPRNLTLKQGIPTKLTLITNQVSSCSRAFTIPSLNIERLLPETGETVIEFTPQKTGPLTFSCSMGMYTGLFNIIN